MVTVEEEVLKKVFGEKGAGYFEYLKNKNRGGTNNSKGNNFENFFAIYRIARAYNEGVEGGKIFFSSQVFCFVDDLVVENEVENNANYFQVRDVESLQWKDKTTNSVGENFQAQYDLNRNLGIRSILGLIVSREEVGHHLRSTIPENLQDIVEVDVYNTNSSLGNLIRDNAILRDELIKMCAIRNPSSDILITLGTILLGAWDSTEKNRIDLKRIIEICYNQNPHFIKGGSNKISEKLDSLLKAIEGFSFTIEGGYIKWEFRSRDKGIIQYRIGSSEYLQWENDIFNNIIKTFEDLEPFLA